MNPNPVMGSVNLNKKEGNLFMASKTYKLNVLSVTLSNKPAGGGRKCTKANQMSKEWAVGVVICGRDNCLVDLAFCFKSAN